MEVTLKVFHGRNLTLGVTDQLKEIQRLASLAATCALSGALSDREVAPRYAKRAVVSARKFEGRDRGPLNQLCANLLKAIQSGAEGSQVFDILDEIGDRINYEMGMEEAYNFLSEGVQ